MSKLLPPRITKPGACSAYGCPLLGSMSTSTGGSDNWRCFAHFGKETGQLQRITAELHLRDQHPDYDAAFERIVHDFTLAQRKDLVWTAPETAEQWLIRLERELVTMLAEPPPPVQVALPLAENSRASA